MNNKNLELEINKELSKEFVKEIFGDEKHEILIQTFLEEKEASYIKRGGSKEGYRALQKKCTRTFKSNLEQVSPKLNRLQSLGAGIFVAINEIEGSRRSNENVSSINAYFIDKDDGPVERYHTLPTVVVSTPQGEHVYFKAFPGEKVGEFSSTQEELINHYKSDPAVKDRARVMRLPGSYHLKNPDKPCLIKIKEINKDERYSSEGLLEGFPKLDRSRNRNHFNDYSRDKTVLEGGRNNYLTKQVGVLKGKGVSIEAALVTAQELNKNYCSPLLSEGEVREIVRSIYKYDKGIDVYPFTDAGRAEGFVEFCKGNLCFVPEWRKWLKYNGRIWKNLSDQDVINIALEYASYRRAVISSLDEGFDKDLMGNLKKDLKKLESTSDIKNYLILVKSLVQKSSVAFDKHQDKISAQNCVVCLRSGKSLDHDRKYYFTNEVNFNYNIEAKKMEFEKFLKSVFQDDEDLILYVKRACGYSVTGENKEQSLFVLYGNGANGKSTFLEIFRYVLGEYVKNAEIKTFQPVKGEKIRNDLARLQGARLVTSFETNEGAHIDEGLVKSITGGEPLTARFLHKEYFEYIPSFKIWFAVNHKPHISGVDKGIWRRIKIVPFLATFEGEKADKNLFKKLQSEGEGVFAWLVEGAVDWYKSGLPAPESVQRSINEYKEDEDYFNRFLEDCCLKSEYGFVFTNDLLPAYHGWAVGNGAPKISDKTLKSRLANHGIKPVRRSNGRGYLGISLKPNIL